MTRINDAVARTRQMASRYSSPTSMLEDSPATKPSASSRAGLLLTLLILAALQGCASLPGDSTVSGGDASSDGSTTSATPSKVPVSRTLEEQVADLLEQRYVDPLSDFIEKNQNSDDLKTQDAVAQMRIERERRCGEISQRYEAREADDENLRKLSAGYARSCPQVVREFASRVSRSANLPEAGASKANEQKAEAAIASFENAGDRKVESTASSQSLVARMSSSGGDATPLEDCKVLYALRNYQQALEVCQLSAERGDAEAQYRTGMVYKLLEKTSNALEWIGRAAEQGYTKAQYQLGVLYSSSDPVEAYAWFELAANRGESDSAERRDRLFSNMSEAQRTSALRRAQNLGNRFP